MYITISSYRSKVYVIVRAHITLFSKFVLQFTWDIGFCNYATSQKSAREFIPSIRIVDRAMLA